MWTLYPALLFCRLWHNLGVLCYDHYSSDICNSRDRQSRRTPDTSIQRSIWSKIIWRLENAIGCRTRGHCISHFGWPPGGWMHWLLCNHRVVSICKSPDRVNRSQPVRLRSANTETLYPLVRCFATICIAIFVHATFRVPCVCLILLRPELLITYRTDTVRSTNITSRTFSTCKSQ